MCVLGTCSTRRRPGSSTPIVRRGRARMWARARARGSTRGRGRARGKGRVGVK